MTFLLSCKSSGGDNTSSNKPVDYESAMQSAQKLILESDSLVFIFPVNKMVTDKPVYKTIYNKAEIEKFANLFTQNAKSDTCKPIGYEASLLVYQQGKQIDSINYSLSANCPTFHFVTNNQMFTSRMSYQCGMYIDNFVQTVNDKMFDKK